MDALIKANRDRWDESVDIHVNSDTPTYSIEDFLGGKDMLRGLDAKAIGNITGKSLLHLQCHFGLDTLSLARRGATVTGVDFSSKAIEKAREIAATANIDARFIESDILALEGQIDEKFDIVYVTWGAINWLPSINKWAQIVSHHLKTGGMLYLAETHPSADMLEEVGDKLVLTYDNFQVKEPIVEDDDESYVAAGVKLKSTRSYEWLYSLSDIITALNQAGLQLDELNEFDVLPYKLFPMMEPCSDNMYKLPDNQPSIPLAFSLKATKK